MTEPAYDAARFGELARELSTHVRELAALGWTPATSSNFSLRLDGRHAAITISGRNKAALSEDDVMVVDMDCNAVGSGHRPSAETLLHTQLYRRLPDVGCVLHTHSRTQTVASRLFSGAGSIRLAGYELLKAFSGNTTHESELIVPVLPNSQDMPTLAAQVDVLVDGGPMWGYLIDGHGLYAWGRDMAEARRHLEAFDFLLGCELDLCRLTAPR
ncbi:methylthioribulose 1-phosphate dehydratase [Luteimonas sp. JM171]|uniref:methylthioribulose 1-phosphate dehydratase n=1 Tax=Luteimonas sp. JM171 TaxID=1896164 RepID=UPI0008588D7F|nr:methylthioribulose 1-phosphate dehydratase [Luteimonas sp. JM171]AOH36809.1 methylthioribulose-1-phosphate dehydratase [Luteimonas sp. JM171]